MTLPNFVVLGAMKAGTTALYAALSQHPEIYVANKEPEFFSYDGLNRESHGTEVYNLADYTALFRDVAAEKALGDVSTTYLPSPRASESIKHHIPDAKLIAILRNPADRAYSHFAMLVKMGQLPPDQDAFLEFFRNHTSKRDPWRTISYRGKYAEHLKRYYEQFDESQIKVVLYEDYVKNYAATINGILSYLQVSTNFTPENTQYWMTGKTKSPLLSAINAGKLPGGLRHIIKTYAPQKGLLKLRLWIDKINTEKLPPLSAAVRKELIDYYGSDIHELQRLINRDLSHWL